MMISFRSVILISTIVRILMILYGDWQDSHMEVRYTDVDYLVFSDAAALMSSGESPFKRTTYRYSPLLAFLLIPNAVFHRSWGKFLFSGSDVWNVLGNNDAQLPVAVISVAMYLLVGYLIRIILKLRGIPDNLCTYSVMAWLFNPFTFTIGTRGNCEPLVCAVILWIITCIMRGKVYQAAIWYGLIVHFRIYPIIYAIPLVLVLDPQYIPCGQKPVLKKWTSHEGESSQRSDVAEPRTLWAVLASMFSGTRILFGLISGVIFLGCTGMFYYLYGMEFLHEALLYHLTRTDPRHNFSIYFYHIYLNYEREFSIVEKLISFLPQFAVQLVLIFRFSLDLPFCFLAQTVAFVAFNKVITAQYFVWFFSLLPVIMPWSKMKMKWEGCFCILCWIGTQLHWLLWGYLLEFKGKNVFLQLWIASLLFLAANTYVLIAIIRHHVYSPIFQRLNVVSKGRLKIK